MDAVFAVVIFGIAIVLITYVWYGVTNQFAIANGNGVGYAQSQLQTLEGRLVSPGSPSDWYAVVNTSNTLTWNNVTIGLGSGGQMNLSRQKIFTLMAMSNYNYQATKQELGIGYDYYITVQGSNYNFAIGINPSTLNATTEQIADVPVTVGGSTAQMQVIVWTNTTFGVA
jgi:hypothetical protein